MAQGLDPAGLDGHAEGAVLVPNGAHLARLSGLADHHGQLVGNDGVQEGDDHHGEHEGHEGVDLHEREEGGSETWVGTRPGATCPLALRETEEGVPEPQVGMCPGARPSTGPGSGAGGGSCWVCPSPGQLCWLA